MGDPLEDALFSLQQAYQEKLREAEVIREALHRLQGMIVVVSSSAQTATSADYVGMGVVEAAKTFLATVGKPMTTRELVDGMRAKGWRTQSRNPTATVYATLSNAKKVFRRTDQGEWELLNRE